ncbi:hypothetical protein KM043_006830 [Ampulex compressa]|nr:hypothetical protein KM043_006830 [Ampulex compressa]
MGGKERRQTGKKRTFPVPFLKVRISSLRPQETASSSQPGLVNAFSKSMAPDVTRRRASLKEDFEEDLYKGTPDNVIDESDQANHESKAEESESGPFGLKTPLVWQNVIYFILLHAVTLYCILTFNFFTEWRAVIWAVATYLISVFGVTAGVHRLWSHRSYKAKWPLRVILLYCFYTAGQLSVYDWVRYHRVHHKYSDTDADPHNSNRGFFFSHIGWLMMKETAEVQRRVKQIDMKDILTDPIVAFGDKHFILYRILCAYVIPVLIPVYFWNDSWEVAIKSQAIIRFVATLHATYSVNSFAHMWGLRPYIASINPVQHMYMSIITLGEGWHNYHHAFPWDYKAAEFGPFSTNVTRYVIDLFSKIGWAYDLQEPSAELIRKVVMNKGDGSHVMWKEVPAPTESKDEEPSKVEVGCSATSS